MSRSGGRASVGRRAGRGRRPRAPELMPFSDIAEGAGATGKLGPLAWPYRDLGPGDCGPMPSWPRRYGLAVTRWSVAAQEGAGRPGCLPIPRDAGRGGAGVLVGGRARRAGHSGPAGEDPQDITLWLLGGISELGGEAPGPAAEARIAGAGPAWLWFSPIGWFLAGSATAEAQQAVLASLVARHPGQPGHDAGPGYPAAIDDDPRVHRRLHVPRTPPRASRSPGTAGTP